MRMPIGIVALALLLVPAARPQQSQLDANESLFTTLAAINMAGYDAELDSPTNHPLRRQIREHLAVRRLASVTKLKAFFDAHRQDTEAAELSQYISFALLSDGPPEFRIPGLGYNPPPDVERLAGLGPLLGEFYGEADIGELYQRVQPAIEEIIVNYHAQVSGTLFELNGYLRNPTSGVSGKQFQVVVSLLGAPNQVHTRSYDKGYFVVVTPSAELQIEEIRYAYLHYVLEPTVSRNMERLEAKRALGDYALGAPHLPDYYKHDFLLLTTASLIQAIEARLKPGTEAEKAAAVGQAWRQGYILAPHFAEQLPAYEQQDQAMRLYFGAMVEAIDLAREEARMRDFEFSSEAPARRVKVAPPPPVEPSEAEKLLAEADDLYRQRKLDPARELFLRILRQTRDKPLQSKAYFGLARVAALQSDPELAHSLFERTLECRPEAFEQSWSLVYLGRLNDAAGDAGAAREYYQQALAVEGISQLARETAEKGLSGAFQQERAQ